MHLERAVPGDLLAAAQTAAARLFPTADAMAAADSARGSSGCLTQHWFNRLDVRLIG